MSNGSYIKYFKNGVLQRLSFEDIYEGDYHAGVSLYMSSRCSVNFGPDFVYKPDDPKILPYCALADVANKNAV